MAEVLLEFTPTVRSEDGHLYTARACGREREDGTWEGWIEFAPTGDGHVLRTPRETTQPNHRDLTYWATGLTATYLEGALARAEAVTREAERPAPREADYDAPAPVEQRPAVFEPLPHAVLDPFEVYSRSGEKVLRQELSALSAEHLRNIIAAHGLDLTDDSAVERDALAELIVAGVRRRTA